MMSNPVPASEASSLASASQETPENKGKSLLEAAGLMAILLLIAKLVGFGRDIMVAQIYGFNTLTDAYYAALQLPQLSLILLGGLGGPFHTATVSVFTALLKSDGKGVLSPTLKAKHLASTLTTLTGILFTLFSIATYFWAYPIMSFILGVGGTLEPTQHADQHLKMVELAALQLKIMSPIILLGGLVGFLYGALNMLHIYIWPALSPVVMSVVMILALFFFGGDETGAVLAWATLLGAVLQWVLQVPEFLGKGFSFMPRLKEWNSPEAQQWYQLLWPAVLGSTLGQLMIYVDMFFMGFLPEGAWSAVVFSNRLMQLPLGVLQTALLVPLFPRLVALVNAKDDQGLSSLLLKGITVLWFVAFPMMLLLGLAPLPFIQALFSHGHFQGDDAQLLAVALAWQSLQIVPYFARDTVTRVFYAYKDSKTPMLVGVTAIVFKALMNYVFVVKWEMGVAGITASITLVTVFNLVVLSFFLKRQHFHAWPVKALSLRLLQLTAAIVPMIGMLYLSFESFTWLPKSLQVVPLAYPLWISILTIGVGGFFYGVVCHYLGIGEVKTVTLQLLYKCLPFLKSSSST
jgi:putative peptidoglycan lipid II flippase